MSNHTRVSHDALLMKKLHSPNLVTIIAAVFGLLTMSHTFAAPPGQIRAANAIGPANAPVTIEFFSDLQCPQCARYEPVIKSLQAEFPDKVRLVLRHWPLREHEHAMLAACAAEAAATQGHFWQMVDALYRTQWMWATAPSPQLIFKDQAKAIGLNPSQFEEDLDSPEVHKRIEADQDRGDEVGVKGVPTVVINGYNVPTSEFTENGFRAAIKAALAKATR